MSEKKRIQDTEAWPLWPRLPVKRQRDVGLPETGFINARDVDDDGGIELYRGNIFSSEIAHEVVKFESLDALLGAGWVGD